MPGLPAVNCHKHRCVLCSYCEFTSCLLCIPTKQWVLAETYPLGNSKAWQYLAKTGFYKCLCPLTMWPLQHDMVSFDLEVPIIATGQKGAVCCASKHKEEHPSVTSP